MILKDIRHVMVINLRYLGDSIWMLPFVENLKRNLPDAKVSVIVNEGTEAFFRTCSSADQVIPFPRKEAKSGIKGIFGFLSFIRRIRKEKPDVTIDLTDADRPAIISLLSGADIRIGYNNEDRWRNRTYTHVVRTRIWSKHMVEYLLDALRELGMTITDSRINIHVDNAAFGSLREKAPSVFVDDGRKKIVVHAGARSELRQWGAENFAALCDALSDTSRIFLVAGPGEKPVIKKIISNMTTTPEICTNDLTLFECAALCELSDMFIGNDSGPVHIASAKTFCVCIYGPTLPDKIHPWTQRRLTIDPGNMPCHPCRQDKCANPEYKACMKKTKPEIVAEKVREVLNGL